MIFRLPEIFLEKCHHMAILVACLFATADAGTGGRGCCLHVA